MEYAYDEITVNKSDIPKISKEIRSLAKKGKIDEALELCEKYEYSTNIQAQRVIILFRNNREEEGMTVCDYPHLRYKIYVQQQKIIFLIKNERYVEAAKAAYIPEFDGNKTIQKLREKILRYEPNIESILANIPGKTVIEVKKEKEVNKVSELYTKVYLDSISLDEISNSDIDEFDKTLLIILYYEKNKLSGILNIIKDAKKKYGTEDNKMDILNKLYNKFNTKKTTFVDYSMYSKYLGCELDNELIEKHSNETQNSRLNINVVPTKTVLVKESPEVKVELNIPEIMIMDVFEEEVEEIKIYLYVQMLRTKSEIYTSIFEKFYYLIEKSIYDKDALNSFMLLAKRVCRLSSYSSIDLKNLEDKRIKYVKPSE